MSMLRTTKRQEIKVQGHLIDSYKMQGGYARKWATERQVGMPDLIATLPSIGCHLVEVKHRPEWALGKTYPNPLDLIQQKVARDFVNGGALVAGAVVVGEGSIAASTLFVFNPMAEELTLDPDLGVRYVPGVKFDMGDAFQRAGLWPTSNRAKLT